jgi:CRP/FNR family transcriptional regulator, anaerobic regulatory protein
MITDVLTPPSNAVTAQLGHVTSGISPEIGLSHMTPGSCLYREGEPRTHVYRVEQGAVAVYEKHIGRPNQTVEIAGPGDFVGLGCFEQYRDSASVIVSSLLTCIDEREFSALAERDPALRQQQTDAIHRDFERRKAAVLDQYPSTPIESLAAFLVSISRQNVHEGRDKTVVYDCFTCGAVAYLLGFDVDTLAAALLDLKRQGLIEEGANGQLHLLSLERLEQLADGL